MDSITSFFTGKKNNAVAPKPVNATVSAPAAQMGGRRKNKNMTKKNKNKKNMSKKNKNKKNKSNKNKSNKNRK